MKRDDVLVDTNVFSFIADERPEAVAFRPLLEDSRLCISFATVGELRNQVDENDLWIAATALADGLPIATGNLRHFLPIARRFELDIIHPTTV